MRRLLIFVKYPTPGRVKTRLAASIGTEAACELYRACAELTVAHMRRFHDETVLCVDPPNALQRVGEWLGPSWRLHPQRGRTLGARLAEAIDHAFSNGANHAVVIGTDSPWLTAEDVSTAFEALQHHDVVLGPTRDGGYYLIGLTRPLPALFEGIAWSTPSVYAQTLARATRLGLHTHLLPEGYDVDQLEDVQRWLHEAQEVRHA